MVGRQTALGKCIWIIAFWAAGYPDKQVAAQLPIAITDYIVAVFPQGMDPNAPDSAPIQIMTVSATAACPSNTSSLTSRVATLGLSATAAALIANPTGLAWDDPNTGGMCEFHNPSFFSAVPPGFWEVAVRAVSAAGSSPFSSAITFVAGTAVVRPPRPLPRPRP
jgi:hypothetical protein